ncbi:hypothetical protein DKT68_26485 [Micromonospora acroterricola]|uniref:DUF418 domain-containing protein n=1 Tax=Micromonospora acroterricola TaxID=2202421 RepID=A0A317CT47_9ACTN|nr:DUF418 domain-containing protein [Micromonospora acroterricola]PWR05537.1 hypothetical protein DKT68_26485 [Micromonospora acroterricola]
MTSTPIMVTPRTGPVPRADRALAPDLARGAMLLFIALANAANFAFAGQPGLDGTPHGLQRAVNFVLATFVDSRAYPVFAVMFGYGLVQIARRQGDGARRILLRRNAALIGFGLVHATLLYFGDFLGAYGVVGIAATLLLLGRGDRFHRVVLWLWGIQTVFVGVLAVLALAGARGGDAVLTNTPNPSLAAASYGRSLLDRLAEWPVHTATVLPFIVIVWLGIWAARHRVLEEPAAHRTLLRRVAVGCLGIAVVGALPHALIAAGAVHVDAATVESMARLHAVSGEYGGPGYVALFGLLALRLSGARRGRALLAPVTALGQRSLSGYLLQSVAWLALFSPWALHLTGTYTAAGAAVAIWLVSLAAAQALSVAGHRGPAEMLLRRITYRSGR